MKIPSEINPPLTLGYFFAIFCRNILLQNLNFKDTNERTVEEMDAEFNINFEVADLGGFQLLDLIDYNGA